MDIEITNDEWITRVAGAEIVISADIKLEINVLDYRNNDFIIETISINSAPYSTDEQRRFNPALCDWERIDDRPEYALLNNAVIEWADSHDGVNEIYEQAQSDMQEMA